MLALPCTNCIIPFPRSWKDSDFKGSKVGSVQGIIHMTTKQQHVWLQRRSNGTVTSGIRGSQDYNTRHWILPPATEGGDFQLQMRPQLDGHFLRLQASESWLIKKNVFSYSVVVVCWPQWASTRLVSTPMTTLQDTGKSIPSTASLTPWDRC